jgi:glutaredoxin
MEENNENKEIKAGDVKEPNFKIKRSSIWMMVSVVLAVFFVISILTHGFSGGLVGVAALSSDEAAEKAVTYINENLLSSGQEATLKSVEESSNLYNLKLDIGGREYDTYVTKDGELLFPSVVNMDAEIETTETETEQEQPAGVVKSDKPVVELFVMSHCPYGTQSEKGMIPVAELLGDKIDFDLKYVNYAMHGEKEVREQILQDCIKKEQESKFLPYLKCFLKEGDTETCVTETGVDSAKLEACEEAVDKKYDITATLANKESWGTNYPPFPLYDAENTKYGVRGSPTLVINGATASSSRSPAAYLATICGYFNEPPEECEEELSSTNPSPGFGYEEAAASNTAAQCS